MMLLSFSISRWKCGSNGSIHQFICNYERSSNIISVIRNNRYPQPNHRPPNLRLSAREHTRALYLHDQVYSRLCYILFVYFRNHSAVTLSVFSLALRDVSNCSNPIDNSHPLFYTIKKSQQLAIDSSNTRLRLASVEGS